MEWDRVGRRRMRRRRRGRRIKCAAPELRKVKAITEENVTIDGGTQHRSDKNSFKELSSKFASWTLLEFLKLRTEYKAKVSIRKNYP